jgi:hypothetical protein
MVKGSYSGEMVTVVTVQKRAIGVFATRTEAEIAISELRQSDFPMENVSVIAKDSEQIDVLNDPNTPRAEGNVADTTLADEGAKTGAAAGGALGTLTGLLVGLGAIAIPGVGPVMLAGATATTLATTLAGTAIGAATGGLVGGLVGLGIPEERANIYNDYVTRGEYLVIVDGDPDLVQQATGVLMHHKVREWGIFDVAAR